MSLPAIQVRNLSKQYQIGTRQSTAYKTLRESLTGMFTNPLRRLYRHSRQDENNIFWALKDISFDVQHGEVLGIIGRNGAGKSTLLKILSRITEPSAGSIDLYGRVGSLLEVGTGFHPELTGRENIYLNGAILGMQRSEIERKFDEIVDFSEIEKFLDTPVKHYSSGMYMRLAFSVAAHLEPEILLVDEVLAVGDAQFQKKCLGKMGDVAQQGRTVLFVSHNMNAVSALCKRGILLKEGRLVADTNVADVITQYLRDAHLQGEYIATSSSAHKKMYIEKVQLLKNATVASSFYNSETLTVRIECVFLQFVKGVQIAFEFSTALGECIFSSTSSDTAENPTDFDKGPYSFSCNIPLQMFRAGNYHLLVSSSVPGYEMLDVVNDALCFDILDDSSPILRLGQNRRGTILPIFSWQLEELQ